MQERIEFANDLPKPKVEYVGEINSPKLPFVFEINPERLGQFLVQELGFGEDRVRGLTFRVTPFSPVYEPTISVTADRMEFSRKLIAGQTSSEGSDVVIDIHSGTHANHLLSRREAVIEYSFMSKVNDSPAYFKESRESLEGVIREKLGERWVNYLKAADWRRVSRFMDRMMEKEFSHLILGTIVHEINHIEDAEKTGRMVKASKKQMKIGNWAYLGASGLTLLGVGVSLGGNEEATLAVLALGILSLGGGILLDKKGRSGLKGVNALTLISEERARSAQEAPFSKWRDIVVVRQNPDYIGS